MELEQIRANMSSRDKAAAALYMDMVNLTHQYDRINRLFDELESIKRSE